LVTVRNWIDLFEAEDAHALPPKPLAQIDMSDVVNALLIVADLRAILEIDWSEIFDDDDLPGEIWDDWTVTSQQAQAIAAYYERDIKAAKRILAPVAAMTTIPISRRIRDGGDPDAIHWSYGWAPNEQTKGRGETVIQAHVRSSDVDWIGTLVRATRYWDAEREITVPTGKAIRNA
jgi:hypothetical protein